MWSLSGREGSRACRSGAKVNLTARESSGSLTYHEQLQPPHVTLPPPNPSANTNLTIKVDRINIL